MAIKILVVGAGIAGLTAGILLQKKKINGQDVEVVIVEKRPSLEHIGGGLGLWPNGAQVLLSLPCAEAIKKLAGDLREECWSDAEGSTLRIVNRDLFKKINGSPFMNVCRSELQEVLLTMFGQTKVLYSTKLVRIEQTADSAIAYFDNHQPIQADLIIGADGTFSTVRAFIFPDAKVNYTGYITLIGICRFADHEKPKHHIVFGQNRQSFALPVSQNRYMVYNIRPYPQGSLAKLTQEEQFQLFKGWSEEADKIVGKLQKDLHDPLMAPHFFCNENFDMPPLSALHRNRVVLMGDAAHRIGSIMGLGTNIALENAQALVDELVATKDIRVALSRFSRKQVSRIAPMIAIEMEKKKFLTEATAETFAEFIYSARSIVGHDEFFQPLISAISPSPERVGVANAGVFSRRQARLPTQQQLSYPSLRSNL